MPVRRRQDVAVRHQDHQLRLDVDGLVVLLERHVVACPQLAFVEDAVLLERLHDVRLHQLGICVHRIAEVEEAAFGGFLLPLVRVVVAIEDDSLVILDQLRQQRLDSGRELLAVFHGLLELGRDVIERFGDRDVERNVRERDALVRRDGTELELVSRERKRARAVAIAGIARQLRQHRNAGIEDAA